MEMEVGESYCGRVDGVVELLALVDGLLERLELCVDLHHLVLKRHLRGRCSRINCATFCSATASSRS